MLTDTHCHLYWNKFDADRAEVIQRAIKAGVERILVPGTTVETSRAAIRLAETYEHVYAAVGVHPTDAETLSEKNIDELHRLAKHEKVVAIGETGLDYYWVKEESRRRHQKQVLQSHAEIANALHKPLVIHLREEGDAVTGPVFDDFFEISQQWFHTWKWNNRPHGILPGVLHSFNGNARLAAKAIEMNWRLGVTGPITYKTNDEYRAMVAGLPLSHLLIETDAPFLAPVPHRGKRNEPAFVVEIADKIAALKSRKLEEIAAATTENAARLFLW